MHAQAQPLVIGLTTPLSGLNAAFGLGLQHGAQLAVDRANAIGGIGGRPLLLVSMDDRGDPGRAAANATRLLERGAVAITGVHGARSAAAVAEVLQRSTQTELRLGALSGPDKVALVQSSRQPARSRCHHAPALSCGWRARWQTPGLYRHSRGG